jgi:hypothetical protein
VANQPLNEVPRLIGPKYPKLAVPDALTIIPTISFPVVSLVIV